MSWREKLLQRLHNNPFDATFADIRRLLNDYGFVLDRISGSHHVFKRGPIIFVVPVHNNRVKSVYVRRVIQIIERLESEQ